MVKNSCEKSEFEIKLKDHIKEIHTNKLNSATEVMEVDTVDIVKENKEGNKRKNRDNSNADTILSSPPCKRASEETVRLETIEEECLLSEDKKIDADNIEETMDNLTSKMNILKVTMKREHEMVVDDLRIQMEEQDCENEALKKVVAKLKKESGQQRKKPKEIQDENAKLSAEIVQIQYEIDIRRQSSKNQEKHPIVQ